MWSAWRGFSDTATKNVQAQITSKTFIQPAFKAVSLALVRHTWAETQNEKLKLDLMVEKQMWISRNEEAPEGLLPRPKRLVKVCKVTFWCVEKQALGGWSLGAVSAEPWEGRKWSLFFSLSWVFKVIRHLTEVKEETCLGLNCVPRALLLLGAQTGWTWVRAAW